MMPVFDIEKTEICNSLYSIMNDTIDNLNRETIHGMTREECLSYLTDHINSIRKLTLDIMKRR